MAFNSAFEQKRMVSATVPPVEKEVSLFSESQNSWVVFTPQEQAQYDILSFSSSNSLEVSEGSEIEDIEILDEHDGAESSARGDLSVALDEEAHEDDDLIEDLHYSLSNRINEWQQTTDTFVSDNIASWDLDADLVSQMLDTSILLKVPAFYGDRLFDGMSKSEFVRFKRTSVRLRRSLTRNGYDSSDPDILSRLFSLLQWQTLLRNSGSMVDDYIVNTRSRVQFGTPKYALEFSETATSSSMVMCGGPSWNDI